MAELYKTADIFVFPSKREGLSVALMEALASGLPVVASRIRGNEDLIYPAINGELVETMQVDKWSKSINKLCDRNYREDLERNNNNIICKIDVIQIQNRIKELYLDIGR